MQLIYRGNTYNYDPTKVKARIPFPHPGESAYELIYRGCTYLFRPNMAKLADVKPRSYELIYRGNTYQVNRNAAGKVTAITDSTQLLQPKISTTPLARAKVADQY
jgi:Domain of unknown function (DUF4278)